MAAAARGLFRSGVIPDDMAFTTDEFIFTTEETRKKSETRIFNITDAMILTTDEIKKE